MRTQVISEENRIAGSGSYVSAEDMSRVISLLKELRDLTQSRTTFAAANDLIARFADEDFIPNLVHDEPAAH